MTSGAVDVVWYASFGSNLSRARFLHYLKGGRLEGQDIGHAGARDPSDPLDDRMGTIAHQLRFGGESRRWGGGVAFVDPAPGTGTAIVRMWKVTVEQFCDIAAQENGLAPGELELDVAAAESRGWLDVTDRWYGRIVSGGRHDGVPVFTFTSPQIRPAVRPSAAYAGTILAGLAEMGLSVDDAVTYLAGAPGADTWDRNALAALLV